MYLPFCIFKSSNSMNFFDYKATKVWFTDTEIWVEINDGRKSAMNIQQFPVLKHATLLQLNNYQLIGDGYAIHWPILMKIFLLPGFSKIKLNRLMILISQ